MSDDPRTTDAATDKAMTILEAQSDQWAVEIDLPSMVKNIAACPQPRLSEAIDRMIRQAFIEGAYRNHCNTSDIILPCDVTLPPSTIFRKGVKLSALMRGLKARADA